MKKLHDPQQQIYEFILRYMQESGGSPTVREICQGVGLAFQIVDDLLALEGADDAILFILLALLFISS